MTVRRADVARLAGTSPAVVSYVLNGGPRSVAPETRARVLAAVEQLDYRPNGVARSLRTNKTMTLGLVVPDTSNPYFAELARAIEEAAFSHGYTLLIGNGAEDDARQTAYVRTFLQRQVDGLFLVPAHGVASYIADLERARTPWITLDRRLPGVTAPPAVLVDNRGGAREATAHLLEHGRNTVACIAGPEDVMPATDRVAGWRDALAYAGLPADDAYLWHVPFGRHPGYIAAREMLGDRSIDAVFTASDEQALGVLRAVTEEGLSCPDDVAITSFDGIAAAAYATPALTTMAQPFGELGRAAVDLLLARMADPGDMAAPSVLPVQLTPRGSCGCADPPGGDLFDGPMSGGR
ncbi:LacI family transcriptional regulator [Actinobacteria bacterium YIM 96077]|uniref:LacI family transcriptional regulator n=1 Tax=Phytoactinopolyspora halophila TaxID=1981511 RepID=A0A329QVA2_9ACTN|nr:LacI family DNA-binding transcriptional regulator [Phytoactinopolyspora halophila]AYY13899.1 LacI family transcriptional regulator [Actinobacteria bacterium YIM 96077]RAW15559.1 LacI family transcriptional regulator [Phytoactinopolyspora halophila]